MELLILKENLFSDQKQVVGKLVLSLLVASSSLSYTHSSNFILHHLKIKNRIERFQLTLKEHLKL
jgi:hypothetical protein